MIRQQLALVIASVAAGMIIVFIYDIIIILRKLIPRNLIWIILEDLLFWSVSAVGLFIVIYNINEGIIRGYSLFGMFLGMIILQWSVGGRLIAYLGQKMIKFRKCLKKIYNRCKIKMRFAK